MWAVACLVITYTQEFTGGLEKNRRRICKSRISDTEWPHMPAAMRMPRTHQAWQRWWHRGVEHSQEMLWIVMALSGEVLSLSAEPWNIIVHPVQESGPYMDKTSPPESLLWVVSVAPKRHQNVPAKPCSISYSYTLLFTGQGCVWRGENFSKRKKTISHPSCHHL